MLKKTKKTKIISFILTVLNLILIFTIVAGVYLIQYNESQKLAVKLVNTEREVERLKYKLRDTPVADKCITENSYKYSIKTCEAKIVSMQHSRDDCQEDVTKYKKEIKLLKSYGL